MSSVDDDDDDDATQYSNLTCEGHVYPIDQAQLGLTQIESHAQIDNANGPSLVELYETIPQSFEASAIESNQDLIVNTPQSSFAQMLLWSDIQTADFIEGFLDQIEIPPIKHQEHV